MNLTFAKTHRFVLNEESKVVTENGGLYQGLDLNLQRTVAVKALKIKGESSQEKTFNYEKALTEVKAMIRIGEENINIPMIYDVFYEKEKGELYIIMEWVKGKTLEKYMNVPEIKMLNWMIDLCDILMVMEKKKIYHKDLKPQNIMIKENQVLYLIDFDISISIPNRVEGTLHYKAPEMNHTSTYQGREKVDIFSVGVILYEYYTKTVPKLTVDYGRKRQRGPFVWDHFIEPVEKNEKIHPLINTLIVRCMKLDHKERYRNISELKHELMKVVREIKWKPKNK